MAVGVFMVFVVGGVVAFVAYHRGEILRLREENRRLREWQGAQGRAPDLGAHRSTDVRALVGVGVRQVTEEEFQELVDGRPRRPRPTTIPGGGRKVLG